MRSRLLMFPLVTMMVVFAAALACAQSSTPPQESPSSVTIRAETRLVLVDTIVTNKKGVYIHDLTAKDFKVYEDGKEQTIKSFSFEADPASPNNAQPRYLVLFFDNSTMQMTDQMQARQAALKFIDANAGPNRLMAVVNYGGSLKIAQNFTPNADLLKRVVSGQSVSATSANVEVASLGAPVLSSSEIEFGQYTVLRSLRSLAKNLTSIPGRKILVYLSAGFMVTPDNMSDLTAAIDACNKANVAIYPIDVRGLVAGAPRGQLTPGVEGPNGGHLAYASLTYAGNPSSGMIRPASFHPPLTPAFFQRPGGGGGGRPTGGGGSTGGGATGGGGRPTGTGGGGGRPAPTSGGPARGPGPGGYTTMPYTLPRYQPPIVNIPSVQNNQQIMYALADGTGGFVIANTNDLLGGLQKIASEQNEYYVLGYTPDESAEGKCHTLKVKIDRGDTVVRSRSGYCSVKPVDMLAGSPVARDLETHAGGSQQGNFHSTITVPYFYTAPNVARVDVSMEIPPDAMKVEKEKGQYHATVNVLGIATTPDGKVAARFSDSVKLDFEDKKDLEAFAKQPFHYEKQFEAPAGQLNLKVVFSSGGESFGKVETPLVIDPNDGKQFTMSGVALSNKIVNLNQNPEQVEDALLEDRTPIVVNHLQLIPSADNQFKKTDKAALYTEVYEPLLKSDKPPVVAVAFKIVDKKTGVVKFESGLVNIASSIQPGNPTIPVGLKLVTDQLDPGDYRLEMQAGDTAGSKSAVRTVDFQVQ